MHAVFFSSSVSLSYSGELLDTNQPTKWLPPGDEHITLHNYQLHMMHASKKESPLLTIWLEQILKLW
jgi:hypothetical protein